ncbi:MAG TPA: hypothetical protein ENO09_04085 [bacterium]|nr:hypothetical protein [bacterium]
MEGIADIIPPPPAHDGLAALLAPSSSAAYGWLLVLLLVVLLVSAVVLRLHWATHWRLWQARRALHCRRPAPEIVTQIERGLRQQHHLSVLHPARAPYGVDASVWRGLIDNLHAARFGQQTLDTVELRASLKKCFTPSPLAGQARSGTALNRAANPKGGGQDSPTSKGWGEGGSTCKDSSPHTRSSPSPLPSPIKGEGEKTGEFS